MYRARLIKFALFFSLSALCLSPVFVNANTTEKKTNPHVHAARTKTIRQAPAVTAHQAAQHIDELIKQDANNINIGIIVQDLDTNKIIYEKNARRYFVPASNLKLLTSLAGLLYLGPDFTFETEFRVKNKKITNGVLNSNLYVKFTGDPDLDSKDLSKMVSKLKEKGIHKIKGNVIVDASTYGKKDLGPGWMWDDAKFCFAAPTSAVMLDGNCFHMHIQPGPVGKPIKLIPSRSAKHMHFTNLSRTEDMSFKNCKLDLQGLRNNHYIFEGCYPKKGPKKLLSVAIKNPEQYALSVLKQQLKQENIKVTGKFTEGHVKGKTIAIVTHHSKPLRELNAHMLKESDNLIADTIFKTLGHKYYKKPGNWKNGAKAVNKILGEKNIDLSNARIVDGAGLSRYDLITPAQILEVLNYAYHNFNIAYEFIYALPKSGIDGTLKYRLKQENTKNRIRAKTGSMKSVTSLAGYIYTPKHHILGFVIIMNGVPGSLHKYRTLEDKICAYLANVNIH